MLTEYNYIEHVPSDIGVDQEYLPAQSYATQDHLNYISNWTDEHMMQLNPTKCNYMIFTRAQTDFATRLSVKNSLESGLMNHSVGKETQKKFV